MTRSSWLCAMAVLAACSSDPATSGVDGSKRLNVLSDSERQKLCSFRTEVEHAPRTKSCDGGASVTIGDTAACVAVFRDVDIQCQATVSDAETCFHAFDVDPCGHGTGGCTALFSLDCVLPTN
jgi:hypothetical protein